jgi:hypothetical protein
MEKIAELEDTAKRYFDLKHHDRMNSDLVKMSNSIIESLSSPSFTFPIEKEGIVSEGTTSYFYINNIACPNLFEFLSQLLHLEVPININKTKFGPGEILISIENEKDARQELTSSIEELKKLIHGKRHIKID